MYIHQYAFRKIVKQEEINIKKNTLRQLDYNALKKIASYTYIYTYIYIFL